MTATHTPKFVTAPLGYFPIPASKHGGWHKIVGGKVVDRWYPPHGFTAVMHLGTMPAHHDHVAASPAVIPTPAPAHVPTPVMPLPPAAAAAPAKPPVPAIALDGLSDVALAKMIAANPKVVAAILGVKHGPFSLLQSGDYVDLVTKIKNAAVDAAVDGAAYLAFVAVWNKLGLGVDDLKTKLQSKTATLSWLFSQLKKPDFVSTEPATPTPPMPPASEPLPVAVAPAVAPIIPVKVKAKKADATIEPMSDIPVVPSDSIHSDLKFMLQSGMSVKTDKGTGTLVGMNQSGQPVVNIEGLEMVVYTAVEAVSPASAPLSFNKLPLGCVRKATGLHMQVVNACLDRPVPGTKGTARGLQNWLRERGYEVYVVGGIVRDLVTMTDPTKKGVTMDALMKAMNDVDFVSTAPPNVLAAAYHAVMPENPGYSGSEMAKIGCVTNGQVDLASLALKNTFSPHAPSVFDHNMLADCARRDFTASALYFDAHNGVIIDPTGTGVQDALGKVARSPDIKNERGWLDNKALAIRYVKMRVRGWKPEAETKDVLVNKAEIEFSGWSGGTLSYIGKQLSGSGIPKPKIMARIQETMEEDGLGHLFAKYKNSIQASINAHYKSHK